MKILNFLQIPIVKWIGIVLILYFGLFANTKNPDSLGNRLSKENVKKNFHQATEKGKFIAANIKKARKMSKQTGIKKNREQQKQAAPQIPMIKFNDLEIGNGEKIVGCNDEVTISYILQDKMGKQIRTMYTPHKLIIGSKKNKVIEQNIVGMKEKGIRLVIIPQGLQTDDKNLEEILKSNKDDLRYVVTLIKIKKSKNLSAHCY